MSKQSDFDDLALEARLADLGITLYQVAKKYSELKGDSAPATKYHSSISKAFHHPQTSKLETIKMIIEALGGRLLIEWDDSTSSKEYEDFKLEARVCELEDNISEIKKLLIKLVDKT